MPAWQTADRELAGEPLLPRALPRVCRGEDAVLLYPGEPPRPSLLDRARSNVHARRTTTISSDRRSCAPCTPAPTPRAPSTSSRRTNTSPPPSVPRWRPPRRPYTPPSRGSGTARCCPPRARRPSSRFCARSARARTRRRWRTTTGACSPTPCRPCGSTRASSSAVVSRSPSAARARRGTCGTSCVAPFFARTSL